MDATLEEPVSPAMEATLDEPKLTKELGDRIARGAIAALGGKYWKATSEAVRPPVRRKAVAAKEQHEKDLVDFREAGDKKRKGKAEKRKGKAAKKGRLAITKKFGSTMNSKISSEQRKKLSEAEKAPYQKTYEEKLAKYKEERKAWNDAKAEAEGGAVENELRYAGDAEEIEGGPVPKKAEVAVFEQANKLGHAGNLKTFLEQMDGFYAAEALAALKKAGGSIVGTKKALSARGEQVAAKSAISGDDVAVFDEAQKVGYALTSKTLLEKMDGWFAAKTLAALTESGESAVAAKVALAAASG